MQRIADGNQELSWQLCFEESAEYCSPLVITLRMLLLVSGVGHGFKKCAGYC